MNIFIKNKKKWFFSLLLLFPLLAFFSFDENAKDRVQARIHTAIYNNKGSRPAEPLTANRSVSKKKGEIYDCFTFFNELEILQIRLEELYDQVDHFVIVESQETHRGARKKLNFLANQQMFKKYLDKIVYVPIERIKASKSPKSWTRENFQRNQIMRGLANCKKEDIILISDLDEIPARADIPRLIDRLSECKVPLLFCGHKTYRYFLNRWDAPNTPWAGTAVMTYGFLKKHFPQYVRRRKDWKDFPLVQSGWHLTTMGGCQKVIEKYKSVVLHRTDTEEAVESLDRIQREMAGQILVDIDETFPQFVQKNREYLKEKGLIDASNWYHTVDREKFRQKWAKPTPAWIVEQVDEELQYFRKHPITQKALNATLKRMNSCTKGAPFTAPPSDYAFRYRVIDNKIYAYGRRDEWIDALFRTAVRLSNCAGAPKLPNLDIIFNLIDGMPMPWNPKNFWVAEDPNEQAPVCCAWVPPGDPFLIPFPQRQGLADWNSISEHILQYNQNCPWEAKVSTAIWRGNISDIWIPAFADPIDSMCKAAMACPRYIACELSLSHPDLVDAGFTLNLPSEELTKFLQHLSKPHIPRGEHLRYKYQLSLDGNGYAGTGGAGYEWRLLSNSVVFKQDSPRITWFESALKPFVHYVPIKQDQSDLLEKVLWARQNDQTCRQIAEAATEFARNELSTESIYYYILYFFSQYAKCQSFDTVDMQAEIEHDPTWVRI